jgi:hypothetical protein
LNAERERRGIILRDFIERGDWVKWCSEGIQLADNILMSLDQ